MGGMGTWSLAVAMPGQVGGHRPDLRRRRPQEGREDQGPADLGFHGDADPAVNVSGSRDMIAAIKKAGGDPKYTEYPGVGHNSWDKAYATDELYEWLLKQKKK